MIWSKVSTRAAARAAGPASGGRERRRDDYRIRAALHGARAAELARFVTGG